MCPFFKNKETHLCLISVLLSIGRESLSLGKSAGCSAGQHLPFVHGEWELSKPLVCQTLDIINIIEI